MHIPAPSQLPFDSKPHHYYHLPTIQTWLKELLRKARENGAGTQFSRLKLAAMSKRVWRAETASLLRGMLRFK